MPMYLTEWTRIITVVILQLCVSAGKSEVTSCTRILNLIFLLPPNLIITLLLYKFHSC